MMVIRESNSRRTPVPIQNFIAQAAPPDEVISTLLEASPLPVNLGPRFSRDMVDGMLNY